MTRTSIYPSSALQEGFGQLINKYFGGVNNKQTKQPARSSITEGLSARSSFCMFLEMRPSHRIFAQNSGWQPSKVSRGIHFNTSCLLLSARPLPRSSLTSTPSCHPSTPPPRPNQGPKKAYTPKPCSSPRLSSAQCLDVSYVLCCRGLLLAPTSKPDSCLVDG
jgi:hypothetical protein